MNRMNNLLLEKINKIEQLLLELHSKIDNYLGFEELDEKELDELKAIREEVKQGKFKTFKEVFGGKKTL